MSDRSLKYRVKQIIFSMYTLVLHIDINKILYTNHSAHFQKKKASPSLFSYFLYLGT